MSNCHCSLTASKSSLAAGVVIARSLVVDRGQREGALVPLRHLGPCARLDYAHLRHWGRLRKTIRKFAYMQLPGIALLEIMKIALSLVPDLPRPLLASTDELTEILIVALVWSP